MRWISKLKAGGIKNFAVSIGLGGRSKLSREQQHEVQCYIAKEGVQLISRYVQLFVKERLSIEISKATAHRFWKKLGFSYITHRPSYHKQDP